MSPLGSGEDDEVAILNKTLKQYKNARQIEQKHALAQVD